MPHYGLNIVLISLSCKCTSIKNTTYICDTVKLKTDGFVKVTFRFDIMCFHILKKAHIQLDSVIYNITVYQAGCPYLSYSTIILLYLAIAYYGIILPWTVIIFVGSGVKGLRHWQWQCKYFIWIPYQVCTLTLYIDINLLISCPVTFNDIFLVCI